MKIFLHDETAKTVHEFEADWSTSTAAGLIMMHRGNFYQFAYTVKGGGGVVFEEAQLVSPSFMEANL